MYLLWQHIVADVTFARKYREELAEIYNFFLCRNDYENNRNRTDIMLLLLIIF